VCEPRKTDDSVHPRDKSGSSQKATVLSRGGVDA